MKQLIILFLLLLSINAKSQSLYFPPLTGNVWDTVSPSSIGWCNPQKIDSLYTYLQQTNTDAFIVLKNGKIVIEKYFGSFTADSIHYWASAGKSLTAMLTGIAQQKGLLNINNTVTSYLGTGWSIAPTVKENAITLKHLLSMNSGLNDKPAAPCDAENPAPECLQYLTDTAQRWGYHTGAYKQLQTIMSVTSGQSYNVFTNTQIGNKIGMPGLWVNGVFYSKPRAMARFGLLILNKGIWAVDTLLRDTSYFNAMTNTSQNYNKSYGYLWWLNGKSSYLSPGLQFVFNGPLFPNAPSDMYCALGKNDQKIYVVPSQQLVVIRVGESTYGTPVAFSPFDNTIWGKIDSLKYGCSYTFTGNGNWNIASNWANNLIPPTELKYNCSIIINPLPGGECILNVPQTITTSTQIRVAQNAKFKIMGNLTQIE